MLGKATILENINSSLQLGIQEQIKSVEKLNSHIESWNAAYGKANFSQMEREYSNIQKEIKSIMPGEKSLNSVRKNCELT